MAFNIVKFVQDRLVIQDNTAQTIINFVLKQLNIPTLPQTPRTELKYLAETLNRSYLTFGVVVYVIGSTLISSNSAQDTFLFALPALVAIAFYLFRLKERAQYEVRHPEDVNYEREFEAIIDYLDSITEQHVTVKDSNVVEILKQVVEPGKYVPFTEEVPHLNRNQDPWES